MNNLSNKQRLDVFLAKRFEKYSRSFLQKFIRERGVEINGMRVKKPHFYVFSENHVAFSEKELEEFSMLPSTLNVSHFSLNILMDDEDFLVIDKPSSLAMHDLSKMLNPNWTPAHRLDKDTSGVLVIAKNPVFLAALQKQWKDREVKKEYVALVKGGLPKRGEIIGAISRSYKDRKKMVISKSFGSREAITDFSVMKDFGEVALVLTKPLTGRTHQIRVHFSSIKHPIVGDGTYGDPKLNKKFEKLTRQFLHASKLTFKHPKSGEAVSVESKLPEDLQNVLDSLTL